MKNKKSSNELKTTLLKVHSIPGQTQYGDNVVQYRRRPQVVVPDKGEVVARRGQLGAEIEELGRHRF
jgi:hypothetical protein